jgi:hypothetical protein
MSTLSTSATLSAAVTLAVAGLLACATPAQADKCVDWIYPLSAFEVRQDNGILVAVNEQPTSFNGGGASYTVPGQADVKGISTGSRSGRDIDISVNWSNGFSNHYMGSIADDGVARGTSVNNKGNSNTWYSLSAYKCVKAPPLVVPPIIGPPVVVDNGPQVPPPVVVPTATVNDDTDIYDDATGNKERGKFVPKGATVTVLVPKNGSGLSKISGAAVPGGPGWVYSDHLSG